MGEEQAAGDREKLFALDNRQLIEEQHVKKQKKTAIA